MVIDNLYDGKAYEKFKEFIEEQNGCLTELPTSKNTYEVKSTKDGYLTSIDALSLDKLSMMLGAGRITLEDNLDYGAGIIINKFNVPNLSPLFSTLDNFPICFFSSDLIKSVSFITILS